MVRFSSIINRHDFNRVRKCGQVSAMHYYQNLVYCAILKLPADT